jgi:hypothetical protein
MDISAIHTFFSDPIFSFLVVYCPFKVAMNHLSTRSMRSCGVAPSEMDANSWGCSHQYAGNSVSEMGDRMTASQVRSPYSAFHGVEGARYAEGIW